MNDAQNARRSERFLIPDANFGGVSGSARSSVLYRPQAGNRPSNRASARYFQFQLFYEPAEFVDEPGLLFVRLVLVLVRGFDDGANALEEVALIKPVHKPPGIAKQPHKLVHHAAQIVERRCESGKSRSLL